MQIISNFPNYKRKSHSLQFVADSFNIRNSIYLLLTLLLLGSLYSCKCNDTKHCSIISEEAEKWMPFYPHDSAKFVNDAGQHIKFAVSTVTKSPFYDERACYRGEPMGCDCDYTCKANSAATFSGDSSGMTISIEEGYDNSVKNLFKLNYSLFNFRWSINLLSPTVVTPYDSVRSAIQLGNLIYQDVYVNAIDTTLSFNQNAKIWKVYYSKIRGVIGFWDRQSQTLYYRE